MADEPYRPPQLPWLLTAADRKLLRSLRIARDDTPDEKPKDDGQKHTDGR